MVGDLELPLLRDARLLRRAVAFHHRTEEELAALLIEGFLVVEDLDPAENNADARVVRHDGLLGDPAWSTDRRAAGGGSEAVSLRDDVRR